MDSLASKIHANFDLTNLPFLALLTCLARHSGSHWCFQFLSNISDGFFEFLVLRVNENGFLVVFLELSSFGFSIDHFCFSFSWAFFPIDFHNSGHR